MSLRIPIELSNWKGLCSQMICNWLLFKVAVWGLAYLAIGGYSHHQARAVREDTLGTQVNQLCTNLVSNDFDNYTRLFFMV